METKPKISVITASKNGARFLRQTIESILQQTFTDYEHIVMDGASTDNTIEILKEYKHIKWTSEPDRHADEGFYKALHKTRGEYIMLCCVSDGYLDQNWFGQCVKKLDSDSEVSLIYALPQAISEDGTPVRILCSNFLDHPPPQKIDFFPFWLGTFFLCPENTFCVRTNVFKECFPKFEISGHFLQNHALLGFNYNFNIKGYLPYFFPVVAAYGRYHHDSNNVRLADFNRIMRKQYQTAIVQYGNEVLSGTGRRKHVFRDGTSAVIKEVELHEFEALRPKILDYRINRKLYLGKKRTGGLNYWLRKFKILIGYSLCRHLIYN